MLLNPFQSMISDLEIIAGIKQQHIYSHLKMYEGHHYTPNMNSMLQNTT
jgi:hypothetical protein